MNSDLRDYQQFFIKCEYTHKKLTFTFDNHVLKYCYLNQYEQQLNKLIYMINLGRSRQRTGKWISNYKKFSGQIKYKFTFWYKVLCNFYEYLFIYFKLIYQKLTLRCPSDYAGLTINICLGLIGKFNF